MSDQITINTTLPTIGAVEIVTDDPAKARDMMQEMANLDKALDDIYNKAATKPEASELVASQSEIAHTDAETGSEPEPEAEPDNGAAIEGTEESTITLKDIRKELKEIDSDTAKELIGRHLPEGARVTLSKVPEGEHQELYDEVMAARQAA
ncbi:hypothetical protein [Kushneria phosphatilytica]|uniref:Uncharacterized protein n=1 Tax=Kushneria phosphatilytica TaxID=657387 RepID=A0A1S1NSB4_9GAMM|nr:hypothetical protein [Kushneria phosphatilytica]OHV12139.1 hypothetical protein BH688_05660 [Kushneria phosphatilytica]QEL11332.1 hypothetical protein FY550_09400 [Kushneria phosphatilytica]